MSDTSLTFLDQLCQDSDSHTWERFVEVYSPLIRGWVDRYDVQTTDADDLVQDVLMVLMRELTSFQHNGRRGAFRNWLRRIVVNRLRNFWRSRKSGDIGRGDSRMMQRLDELEDSNSQISQIWNREHNRHLTRKLLEMIQPKFAANTQKAFCRLVLDGADADEVAAELNMTLGAVFTAKSRVLRELRRIGKGLFD